MGVSSQQSTSRDNKRPRDSKFAKPKVLDAKKARLDEELTSIQGKMDSPKKSVGLLQNHFVKGTCPKTLRYYITPHQEFKTNSSSIRKKTEQALESAESSNRRNLVEKKLYY